MSLTDNLINNSLSPSPPSHLFPWAQYQDWKGSFAVFHSVFRHGLYLLLLVPGSSPSEIQERLLLQKQTIGSDRSLARTFITSSFFMISYISARPPCHTASLPGMLLGSDFQVFLHKTQLGKFPIDQNQRTLPFKQPFTQAAPYLQASSMALFT